MVFVFDENIPSKIVETLSALYKDCAGTHNLYSVEQLNMRGTKDVDLMPKIKETFPEEKCIFISGDKNILKRPPELEAIKNVGFVGFICAPSSCQKNFLERGLYIMNLWPRILELAEKSRQKTIYKMPAISFVPTEKEFKKL